MGVRLERAVASFGLDAPDADGLVVGGREEVLAARVEHQAAHPVIVADQRDQTLARAHVPDLSTQPEDRVSGHWPELTSQI